MDVNQSAFLAYKKTPTKFVEKQKSPKKKSKHNGRDKTPIKTNGHGENQKAAKKRTRPVNPYVVNIAGLSNASASDHFRVERTVNGTPSAKAKVNKSKHASNGILRVMHCFI